MRNYLCLLGWSPKDDREILSIEEIIKLFDLPGINKNNAKFDDQKLSHINGEYIRQLSIEDFTWLVRPVLTEVGIFPEDGDEDYLQAVLKICQEKVRSIEGVPAFASYFFTEDFEVDEKAKEKVFKKGDPIARLKELSEAVAKLDEITEETLEQAVNALCEEKGTKAGEYMLPGRLAVSGEGKGPTFYGMLRVLGKDKIVSRIERFIASSKV